MLHLLIRQHLQTQKHTPKLPVLISMSRAGRCVIGGPEEVYDYGLHCTGTLSSIVISVSPFDC